MMKGFIIRRRKPVSSLRNKNLSNRLPSSHGAGIRKEPVNENMDSQLEKAKEKIANLRHENMRLVLEKEEQCEASYNMCLKFLRTKHSEAIICQMLHHLQKEHQKKKIIYEASTKATKMYQAATYSTEDGIW